ncbi:MAG: VWA domain-containing protein [Spirochaetaceae bacterium]|nr:VWA domain-containing protein [Spirochaetaceae bacterium]
MKQIKFASCFVFIFFVGFLGYTQDLTITNDDIALVTQISENNEIVGFNLYIRKKPDINSVLLTETTKDPLGKEANYAYRATEWNAVNGDEIRMLDGKPLVSEYAKYSIIDSTLNTEYAEFGSCFCLYIPLNMVYGYPWTRNGTVQVALNTFVNIRTFGAKYGDYSAGFKDNPFMFDLGEIPYPTEKVEPVILTDSYNKAAVENFASIASSASGELIYSDGPETLVQDIIHSLQKLNFSSPVDVVFAIDATGSMKDDIQQLRKSLVGQLDYLFKGQMKNIRIGLLLYRDYTDSYNYKGLPVRIFPFTQQLTDFEKSLNSFSIYGTEGGDIPEAVNEALFASMDFYQWRSDAQKKIILIGDAEAHPTPRGSRKYTKELVQAVALARGIIIDTIITPDGKSSVER